MQGRIIPGRKVADVSAKDVGLKIISSDTGRDINAEFDTPLAKVESDRSSGFICDLQEDRSRMEFDEQFIAFCQKYNEMMWWCMQDAFDEFINQHPMYSEDHIYRSSFSSVFIGKDVDADINLRDAEFIHQWIEANRACFLKYDELFVEYNVSGQLLRNIKEVQSYQDSFEYFIALYPQYENKQNYFNQIGTLMRMFTDRQCNTDWIRIAIREELIRDIITFCSISRKKSARFI